MPRPTRQKDLIQCGGVALEPLDSMVGSSHTRYLWQPDPDFWKAVLKSKPFPLGLRMDCVSGIDDYRRFTPSNGGIRTIADSMILGSAIFDAFKRVKPERDLDRACAIQLWQIAPKLREYFARNFSRISDLRVSRGARSGRGDVLPERLGVPKGGGGRPWTIAKLLKYGEEAARSCNRHVNQEVCIHQGLFEAAKLDPVDPRDLTKSNARRTLRHCIFDLGPSSVPDKRTRRLVRDRFINAVQRHADVSLDEFQNWISKDFDNVVHQIAKQTRQGGPIDRSLVRQALVEESFDAHFEVAQAADQGMRAFAATLPDRLNAKEKLIFSTMYYGQSWLGGVTVAMLSCHWRWLKPGFVALLADPRSVEIQGAILRLLEFHGEMTRNRREADRETKSRRIARNHQGRPAKYIDRDVNDLASRSMPDDRIDVLAEQLAARASFKCKCRSRGDWSLSAVDLITSGHKVTLRCKRCGQAKAVELKPADVKRLRRELAK